MKSSPRKIQAALALGLALLLWGGWAAFGTPLRVRWIISRGAPPAGAEVSEEALDQLRTVGPAAKGALLSALEGSGSRARKSWIAAALLRAPFFARTEVEAALASGDPSTARAAAYSLMGGEWIIGAEAEGEPRVLSTAPVRARRASAETWDPAPAVPVLLDWLADRGDLEARFAAGLLGSIPPGDVRIRDGLLAVVEEIPRVIGPGAGDLQLRKFTVVESLKALAPWAVEDPGVVARVSKVVSWIDEEGLSSAGWDLQAFALQLVEVSRGRGVDPELLVRLSRSPSSPLRQRLANVLEHVPGAAAAGILEYLVFDESPMVRLAAARNLSKRKEPSLLDLVPVLVEDSYVFVRTEALRSVGVMRGVEPARCRAMGPLLVSCIEEPWQGEEPAPGTPQAAFHHSGKVEVMEAATLVLWQLFQEAPGFLKRDGEGKPVPGVDGRPVNEIFDAKRRTEIAGSLVEDGELRASVVAQWREFLPMRPAEERVAPLVRRLLEDRDPETAVRVMRELVRLTGDDATFPPAALLRRDDDVEARNAVRAWWKEGGREKAREHWGPIGEGKR